MIFLKKLLLLLCLSPCLAFAQSNYRAGYVLDLKGDTLKGFIDYKEWDSNPTSISFKSSLTNDEKQTYSLQNSVGFGVDGQVAYKKLYISISTDETNINKVESARDTSFKMDTVFLKVLQHGSNLALYQYTDDIKTRFYIGDAPGFMPVELVYRIYNGANGNTIYENGYQKQLFALAIKYNMLDDKLNAMFNDRSLSYNEDDILKIVSYINHISAAEQKEKYGSKSKLSFYVGPLLNISNTSSGESSYTAGGGIPYTSYQPGFSVGLDFFPNPDAGKVEFHLNVSYAPAKMDAVYKLTVSPYSEAEASYSQSQILIAPEGMYNFYNTPNFKFYLGIGYYFSLSSFSNSYFGPQDRSANPANFPTDAYAFQSVESGVLFKAGMRIHKNWEIYMDYYPGQAATGGGYFALNNQNTVIGVNYFFGQ